MIKILAEAEVYIQKGYSRDAALVTAAMDELRLAVETMIVKLDSSAPIANSKPVTSAPAPTPVTAPVPVPTLESLRDKALELSRNGKKNNVVEILQHFNVEKITQLKPENYADFMAAMEAL